MTCATSAYKQIKIGLNGIDLTDYTLDQELFETIDITRIVGNEIVTTTETFLVLFVDPEGYNRKVEYTDLDIYSWGNYPNLQSEINSIDIRLDYTEVNLIRALDAINKYHITNQLRLNILDYVSPNLEDYFTQGFTERYGIFNFDTYLGEYIGFQGTGIQVKFLELPEIYKTLIINNVTYYVKDTDYKVEVQESPTTLQVASKGTFLDKSLVRLGFTAKMDYSSIDIYRNLLDYAKNAIETNTSIIITDNLNPEGYTSRTGFILVPFRDADGIKLFPNSSVSYLPKGFSITFLETNLRYA